MTDVCPICEGKLGKRIILTNPPLRGRKCEKCGRVEDVPRELITRSPKNQLKWGETWSTY